MTNEEVFRTATGKRTFMGAIRERRWKTSEHDPETCGRAERYGREVIEGKKTAKH